MATVGARSKPWPRRRQWLHRVGWLVLIWSLSVVALAAVAMLFRLLMKLAGLSG
jgi:hypothetical protein